MLQVSLLAIALAVASASLQTDWEVYKKVYDKKYDADEDILRRFIYQSNMKKIQEHNELYAEGKSSYVMGENQFTDWTYKEVNDQMNGVYLRVDSDNIDFTADKALDVSDLPKTVDWRKKGYVTPVKDQGQCGSCWAFSAVGSMEGAHFKKAGKLIGLSESNLVDCSRAYGNMGCDGGLMIYAFNYVLHDDNGIDTEKFYPYVPKDEKCKYKKSEVGATFKNYVNVTFGSEKALQKAVATIGPISVAIDATDNFMNYKKGVMDDNICSSVDLNHAVLVVGYGTEDGKDFWLVKNSWNTSWGDEGYIKMSRNKNNQCGIASAGSYPIA